MRTILLRSVLCRVLSKLWGDVHGYGQHPLHQEELPVPKGSLCTSARSCQVSVLPSLSYSFKTKTTRPGIHSGECMQTDCIVWMLFDFIIIVFFFFHICKKSTTEYIYSHRSQCLKFKRDWIIIIWSNTNSTFPM